MTELEQLTEAFRIANANFEREDRAVLALREKLDLLPLNATPDQYARLQAELELQKRRVTESARRMAEAGSRLDEARAIESQRAQREADRAQLIAKQSELRQASNALAEKKAAFQRLASEIPAAEARVFVLMQETAILQQRVNPVPKQSQPRWYDSEWSLETTRRGGDLAAMLGN
jgi:chromosome segregation ATPase